MEKKTPTQANKPTPTVVIGDEAIEKMAEDEALVQTLLKQGIRMEEVVDVLSSCIE